MKFDGIEGKVAIVTGAGGGIGEAYAKALAAQGASVVVAEINKEKGERVAEEIRKSGADASRSTWTSARPNRRRRWPSAPSQAFGGIDFLVNNAAIFGDMKIASLIGVDWDYYQRFMDVNMHGALLCTRACSTRWRARRRRDREPVVDGGVDGRRLLRDRQARRSTASRSASRASSARRRSA